jgi:hypothetical protein
MPKVLIVEFCALKREVDRQVALLFSCFSLSFFFRQKFVSEKNVTHRHSQHTVCDGVSGVTEEGYLPGVPVCLVSVTGSAVRVGQGVFSVFFVRALVRVSRPGLRK